MSTSETLPVPFGFDEDVEYMLQVLSRGRWAIRGRGKLTFKKALRWKTIADRMSSSMRIRKRLPNGEWDSTWCASTPYGALIAIVHYLERRQLKADWELVKRVWNENKERSQNPRSVFYAHITELRRIDRKIEEPLRRLLDTGEYIGRIGVHGAPAPFVAKCPFKWNGKHYTFISVRENR